MHLKPSWNDRSLIEMHMIVDLQLLPQVYTVACVQDTQATSKSPAEAAVETGSAARDLVRPAVALSMGGACTHAMSQYIVLIHKVCPYHCCRHGMPCHVMCARYASQGRMI